MEELGTGAGLAALGFWMFVAIIVAVGVFESTRKRETQHETLRRLIESGQPIDENLTNQLLDLTAGSKQLDRDLKVGAIVCLFMAPGLVLFGWLLSIALDENLLGIMLAIGALLGTIGIGLLVASYVVQRWYSSDETLIGD